VLEYSKLNNIFLIICFSSIIVLTDSPIDPALKVFAENEDITMVIANQYRYYITLIVLITLIMYIVLVITEFRDIFYLEKNHRLVQVYLSQKIG
jgi:hypothetical protein